LALVVVVVRFLVMLAVKEITLFYPQLLQQVAVAAVEETQAIPQQVVLEGVVLEQISGRQMD
jgi:hypothetical protein